MKFVRRSLFPKGILSVFALLLIADEIQAVTLTDTNSNGMSDYWEKHWNGGALFSGSFLPTADSDGDGWSNLTESIAGTNPNDPRPPDGLVRPRMIQTPVSGGASTTVVAWPSVIGKQYTLLVSSDLSVGSWTVVGSAKAGTGSEIQVTIDPPSGTNPARQFWRVSTDDADADNDTVSDYEEAAKGTNPSKSDTDADGIPDNLDTAPLTSATLADPDGLSLPSALTTNLRGFWDFETQNNGTTIPAVFPDRSGGNRHATSVLYEAQGLGMPSKAAKISPSPQYVTLPPSTFQNQSTWTISGWIKFAKNGISNLGSGYRTVYALYDLQGNGPAPQKVQLAQGNVLMVAKIGTTEQWFVGGYRQTYYTTEPGSTYGNPLTKYEGHTFTLPLGTTDDGKWHHFAVTRSATSNGQKVYFNGVLTFEGELKDFGVDYDSDTFFTFGRLYPAHTATALPEAHVDRVRVHSKLLSSTHITSLYQQDIDQDGKSDVVENATRVWKDKNLNGVEDPGESSFTSSPYISEP